MISMNELEILLKEAENALQQTVEYQRVEELKEELANFIERQRKEEFLSNIQRELESKGYELRTGHPVDLKCLIVRSSMPKINWIEVNKIEALLVLEDGTYENLESVLGQGNSKEDAWLMAYSRCNCISTSDLKDTYYGTL